MSTKSVTKSCISIMYFFRFSMYPRNHYSLQDHTTAKLNFVLQYISWVISDKYSTQMCKLTFVVQQTSICVKQSLDFSPQFWKCWPRECSLFQHEYLRNCSNSFVRWKQRYFHHCYELGRVHKQECEHYYQVWAPAQRFEMVEIIPLKKVLVNRFPILK